MFKLSERSKKNRDGVDPKLIAISDLAITLTLVDFGHGPLSGLRTDEEQNELFNEGMSKADGYVKRGKHQKALDGYGKALDFYAYVNGHASWKPEHLAMVAIAFFKAANILGIQIEWGGLWKDNDGDIYGWDLPHIQLVEI